MALGGARARVLVRTWAQRKKTQKGKEALLTFLGEEGAKEEGEFAGNLEAGIRYAFIVYS